VSHTLFDSSVHPGGGGLPNGGTFEGVFRDGEEASCQAKGSWVSVEEIEGGIVPSEPEYPDCSGDIRAIREKRRMEFNFYRDSFKPDPIANCIELEDDGWLPRGSGPRKGGFSIRTLGVE
jgi:hypothetical protein